MREQEQAHVTKMKSVQEELEELRDSRKRQEQHVKALVRQRDMFSSLYKRICEETGRDADASALVSGSPHPPSNRVSTPSTPVASKAPTTPGSTQAQNQLLEELQTSFKSYRDERAANDQMIMNELEVSSSLVYPSTHQYHRRQEITLRNSALKLLNWRHTYVLSFTCRLLTASRTTTSTNALWSSRDHWLLLRLSESDFVTATLSLVLRLLVIKSKCEIWRVCWPTQRTPCPSLSQASRIRRVRRSSWSKANSA